MGQATSRPLFTHAERSQTKQQAFLEVTTDMTVTKVMLATKHFSSVFFILRPFPPASQAWRNYNLDMVFTFTSIHVNVIDKLHPKNAIASPVEEIQDLFRTTKYPDLHS